MRVRLGTAPECVGRGAGTLSRVTTDHASPPVLVARGVYRIASRNLTLGVYDGDGSFLGIRHKFGYVMLDQEFLAGEGRGGTARALDQVGDLPDDIELVEGWSTCEEGRRTAWRDGDGRRYRVHLDDGSAVTDDDTVRFRENTPLLEFLATLGDSVVQPGPRARG